MPLTIGVDTHDAGAFGHSRRVLSALEASRKSFSMGLGAEITVVVFVVRHVRQVVQIESKARR
jgi:hypothetical protein